MTQYIPSIYSLEKRTRQQRDDEERNKEEIIPLMDYEEDNMKTGTHLYSLSYCPFKIKFSITDSHKRMCTCNNFSDKSLVKIFSTFLYCCVRCHFKC